MSAWPRSVTSLALAVALFGAAPAASAQTPAEQADRLNSEGKVLFADKSYEAAYAKFREAATLSPEGRFFFNMCYALNFLERYQEAIQACEQVEAAGADAALIDKTRKALASLHEKAGGQAGEAAEGAEPTPASEHRAGAPRPVGRRTAGGGGPPPPRAQDPFVGGRASAPPDSYKWSIGGTVGLLGNLSVGRTVDNIEGRDQEIYGPGGLDVRLFSDFILSEASRFGLQASIGFGVLPPGQDNLGDDNLVLADVGAAIFLHLPLGKHLFMTPLVGPQLSVQQPQELSQGFIAFGSRAELGFSYVFGPSGEHAISVTPAINVYFPAGGEVSGATPEDFGLDLTRATFGVSAGYTFRFSTPFGTVPLITLE